MNKEENKQEKKEIPPFEHPMNIEDFRKNGYQMVDKICEYYSNIEKKPVLSTVEPGYLSKLLPTEAPQSKKKIKN
jgi:hypothetical protein